MEVNEAEFMTAFQRLIQLQAEQATFNAEVTAALTAIGERLDRIDQRLDQLSRAIQPRLVNTPFSRDAGDKPSPDQVSDTDVPE